MSEHYGSERSLTAQAALPRGSIVVARSLDTRVTFAKLDAIQRQEKWQTTEPNLIFWEQPYLPSERKKAAF